MENRETETTNTQELKSPKSTSSQAYFNFIKSNLGIGAIVLPFVTYQVGLLWSIILFIPISFSCLKSSLFVIEVADDLRTDNILYADLIKLTLGSICANILDIAIILQLVGLCIAYLLFLTESVTQSLHEFGIELTKFYALAITLVILIPLTFIRKIHFFHSTSKYGFYAALLAFCVVLYDCQNRIHFQALDFSNLVNWDKTFNYVGVAILCCEGIFTVLPIRDSMKNKFEFKSVASQSLLTAFAISIFLSLVSASTYKGEIRSILFFGIEQPIFQVIALLFYSISLLLTFPLQLFPAVQIIEQMVQTNHSYQKFINDIENNTTIDTVQEEQVFENRTLQIIIRTSLIVTIYFVAYFVPHLSHFLNLIGSIFGSLLQFCFPVLVHYIYFKNNKQYKPILQYSIILVVSALAIVLGTAESLKHLI